MTENLSHLGAGVRLALPDVRSAAMRHASMIPQVWGSVTALTSGECLVQGKGLACADSRREAGRLIFVM